MSSRKKRLPTAAELAAPLRHIGAGYDTPEMNAFHKMLSNLKVPKKTRKKKGSK